MEYPAPVDTSWIHVSGKKKIGYGCERKRWCGVKLLGTAVIGVRGGCGACVRWIKGGREVEKETKRGKNEGGRERERESNLEENS